MPHLIDNTPKLEPKLEPGSVWSRNGYGHKGHFDNWEDNPKEFLDEVVQGLMPELLGVSCLRCHDTGNDPEDLENDMDPSSPPAQCRECDFKWDDKYNNDYDP